MEVPDPRIDRTRRHELMDMLHGQQHAASDSSSISTFSAVMNRL